MSSLRPLANLFALCSRNKEIVARAEARCVAAHGQSWRPHPSWVVLTQPLPFSEPDGADVRTHGFAFAEGRDAMLGVGADRERGAAELSLQLEQGNCELKRWNGDFGFIWFGKSGQAVAARSCAGLVPVYVWEDGETVAIATRCGALPELAGWRGALNPLATAMWCMAFPGNLFNASHFAGVRTLGAGESIRVEAGSCGPTRRYWEPQPEHRVTRGTATDVADRQRRLRSVLLERLSGDLDREGRNLLSLSGGVDSGAVLALAAKTLKFPMMTWSQVPPENAATRERELGYIEPLRRWAGVTAHWQTDATAETSEELIPQAPAIPFPVLHPALCSLARIRREAEVVVLVGGEFADEICGARLGTPDWATGTSLLELLSAPSRWPYGISALPRWVKTRLRYAMNRPYLVHPDSLPGSAPDSLQEQYRDLGSDLRRWASSLPVPHRMLWTRHLTIDFAAMNWEACSAYGIRRSIPFLSRELIELTMQCHPSELMGPDTKRLLRGALHDDVPRRTLYRPDKGNFGLRFDGLRRPIEELRLDDDRFWDELSGIVAPQWRRNAQKQGWLSYEEKYPLLYLMTLQKNLAAVSART